LKHGENKMQTISDLVAYIYAEIKLMGYNVDEVMSINNIYDDEDLIMFALRFLMSNVDEALLDDEKLEKDIDP
jgi:hypothetical protein